MDEVYITCPLCSTGTITAVQNYLAIEGGIPVWYASCDNDMCICSEGGEVMGGDSYEFPLSDWLEEFGVYSNE